MPRSTYDRFADTPLGGAAVRWFWGTQREPNTLFHRTLPTILSGTAYAADYMLRGTMYPRSIFTPGANPPKRQRRALRIVGRTPLPAMGSLGPHFRVRGLGRKRTLKRFPTAVKLMRRTGQVATRSITHELNSELRTKAGGQGVVTVISERLLPKADRSGAICRSINREDGGSSTDLAAVATTPDLGFNILPGYIAATDDGVHLTQTVNHRQDWTMFTNGSWRDGYAYMNGNLPTSGSANAQTGYITPGVAGTNTGNPAGWNTMTGINQGAGNTAVVVDSLALHPTSATVSDSQLGNYYHLKESITWKFTNNSPVPVHITIYEHILARDIFMGDMASLNQAGDTALVVRWGGMPCPIELWRQSREISYDPVLFGAEGQRGADWSVFANERETRGVCSAQLGRDPTTSAGDGGMTVGDIDRANATPDKAHLLHTWYRIIPHTRTIGAGQSTTITIAVHFNRRIPGAWWNMLYGVSGLTRCFTLVTRPDFVTGVTGVDEGAGTGASYNRRRVMAPTDLMVSWTKSKTFSKTAQRIRGNLYVRAAMPEVDDAVMRDRDGDAIEVDVPLNGNGEGDANATGGAGDGYGV